MDEVVLTPTMALPSEWRINVLMVGPSRVESDTLVDMFLAKRRAEPAARRREVYVEGSSFRATLAFAEHTAWPDNVSDPRQHCIVLVSDAAALSESWMHAVTSCARSVMPPCKVIVAVRCAEEDRRRVEGIVRDSGAALYRYDPAQPATVHALCTNIALDAIINAQGGGGETVVVSESDVVQCEPPCKCVVQ